MSESEPKNGEFRVSEKKNKKYDVYWNGKWISFGHSQYSHYRDRTGLGEYSYLDNNDRAKRKAYLARAKGIKDKDGKLTYKDKNSPNYWAVKYLW